MSDSNVAVATTRSGSLFYVLHKGDYAFGAIVVEPTNNPKTSIIRAAIHTSCGNFGYCWSSAGGNPCDFLKTMSRDYAIEKLSGSQMETTVINDRATTEALFKDVAETFADDEARRNNARAEVQQFMSNSGWRSIGEFLALAESGLCPFPYKTARDIPYVTEMAPDLVRFWEVLWPEILKQVESDFKAGEVVS